MTFNDWDDIHKYSPNVDGSDNDVKKTGKDVV